jgi:hypothetical protein
VPTIGCHDGRTIRYPHPSIKKHDSVKFNLKTGKIEETIKFGVGALVMVTSGRNLGRVGQLKSVEKHEGSDNVVHIEVCALLIERYYLPLILLLIIFTCLSFGFGFFLSAIFFSLARILPRTHLRRVWTMSS